MAFSAWSHDRFALTKVKSRYQAHNIKQLNLFSSISIKLEGPRMFLNKF